MTDPFKVALRIDGQALAGAAGTVDLCDPATGLVIGEVAQADATQLQQALDSSARGFALWSATGAPARARILRAAADGIRAAVGELAPILTREMGKTLLEARGEWLLGADGLDWAAEEGRRTYGRVIPSRAPNVSQVVHRFPLGPVAAFTPWNFPVWSPIQKIAPALAAGCSIILKPASATPASAQALARILAGAGLPDGVLNVVTGRAALIAEALIASPVIRKVSLTGSVEVGRTLAALAGRHLKKSTMELGGHAPVIVMDDVDAAAVGSMAAVAKYRNAGQVCTSPTRFFVHEAVYGRFRDAFVARASALRVGNGMQAGIDMGPLVNGRQVAAMQRMVRDAVARGGTITLGGERIGNSGSFFQPTLVEDVPDDALVATEEPFGPIAVLRRIRSLDEAVERANAVPYGLASYAFTHDANRQARLTRGVEAGMLAFNQFAAGIVEGPFAGIRDSGWGAEGGTEGVEGYMHTKFVSHLSE